MEEIKCMAEVLGAKIEKSSFYQEYVYYAKRMQSKPALVKKIALLKQLQLVAASSQPEGKVTLESEMKLCELYADIAMDEDAIGFWHSERHLLNLLHDTLETVSKHVPMDLFDE